MNRRTETEMRVPGLGWAAIASIVKWIALLLMARVLADAAIDIVKVIWS